ncbi:MAG TPA: tRNA preQ1(34) S-adenosylmethionine ribosyltransferase-isomerase QueA [Casimicrobiaceae bacterium]|nr:tRNA preQ1(34) S-adenosylmethionine ribosyltransferase-isomerase QueA [Casimicrobiaceae bacterium]
MRYGLSDFDYALPPELIARVPASTRSASRLLCVEGMRRSDRVFSQLPSLLTPGDLVVFNDTRVIKARVFGQKATGGRVELLIERVVADREAWAQVRASHTPRTGSVLHFADGASARVIERDDRFHRLAFEGTGPLYEWLEAHGEVPLPPYIGRRAESGDAARYQTIYAREPGAVAAPTAGLHFDAALMDALDARGVARGFVTLHVGAGTFQPVQHEELARHRMHEEAYSLPQSTVDAVAATRARGGRVVAIGTTTLRALEAAAHGPGGLAAGSSRTALFITPGYRFAVVDRLVTNFHLPRSTLLMLVSAFAGFEPIRAAYAHAIAQRYRFYSYGDAMLLTREPSN